MTEALPDSAPALHSLLRHRGPALLLEQVTEFDGESLSARAVLRASWEWPVMLEAAAQCAGLLLGMRQGGLPVARVVAAYEDLLPIRPIYDQEGGALLLRASQPRKVLEMWKCHVMAQTAAGEPLLTVWVTLAAAAGPPP